jgi:hypothetical protein
MPEQEALHAPQNDDAAPLANLAATQGGTGGRHAVQFAGALERQRICQPTGLEHVTDRSIGIRQQLGWRVGLYRGPGPDREDLARQPVQRPKDDLRNACFLPKMR